MNNSVRWISPTGDPRLSKADAAIDRWRTELLDLSKRNPLLLFRPGSGGLALFQPSAEDIFAGLLNHSASYHISPLRDAEEDETAVMEEQLALLHEDDSPAETQTNVVSLRPSSRSLPPRPNQILLEGDPKKLRATLRRLRLRARTALMERGVNVLFAAFGILEWTEARESAVRMQSPLLLVPVRLERESELAPYILTALDEGPVLNPTLVRKLQLDFGLSLELPDENDIDFSLSSALSALGRDIERTEGWSIRSEAYLGLFSFAKYAMYADLEQNRARFSAHPVVRAIAGEEAAIVPPDFSLLQAERLDAAVAPSETFQVLDADASQQQAIEAVKAGANLVIQGPPGTGKSQTITNIIAESLAQNKTVLFVSEKMAALRVVATRLKEAGLSEFCLEAHSQDVQKAVIIKELARSLQSETVSGRAPTSDFSRLVILRQQLNAYVTALHDNHNPLARSAFEVHGWLAKLSSVPSLPFQLAEIGSLTPQRLEELRLAVDSLTRVSDVLLARDQHPWSGCIIPSFTPRIQVETVELLRQAETAAEALETVQDEIRQGWRLPAGSSLVDAEWLVALLPLLNGRHELPASWLSTPSLEPAVTRAQEFRSRMAAYHERRAVLLEVYEERLFQLDFGSIVPALESGGEPSARHVLGGGAPCDRVVTGWADLEPAVARLTLAIENALAQAMSLASALGMDQPLTIADTRTVESVVSIVVTDPRPQLGWFEPGELAQLAQLAAKAAEQQSLAQESRRSLSASFALEFFDLATDELAQRFEQDYATWRRPLKLSYRRDMKRLRSARTAAGDFDYESALEALRLRQRLRIAESWLEQHSERLVASFGRHFRGAETDWASVQRSLAQVARLEELLDGRRLPMPLLHEMIGEGPSPRSHAPQSAALKRALGEVAEALGDLSTRMTLLALFPGAVAVEGLAADRLIGGLRSWLDSLRPFQTAAAAMIGRRREGQSPTEVLLRDAREARAALDEEDALTAVTTELKNTFGHLYNGLQTDWSQILAGLGWAEALRACFGGPVPSTFAETVLEGAHSTDSNAAQLQAAKDALRAPLAALAKLFARGAFQIGRQPLESVPLPELGRWLQAKRDGISQLESWIDCCQAAAHAERIGLGSFLERLQRDAPDSHQWREIFERHLFALWLTWRYEQAPELLRFRGRTQEDLILEFRQLDVQQWRGAAGRIGERLRTRRPTASLSMHPRSEPGILLREASKRRRFRPLRKLFADLPTLLPALKPCMLMSPLSVAQFFGDSAIMFDLLVFDEASQIIPADAIGAIGRAKQVVVVGDQQQLPPTSFFGTAIEDPDDDEDAEAPESILDACLGAGLPQSFLRWHYRSRHEDLIAFSNMHFYDHRLITFPSPQKSARSVRFIQVPDGIYDRAGNRTNRVEAQFVADLVEQHVVDQPGRSLGVITFSEPQMLAIVAELSVRKRQRPELEAPLSEERPDGFFIKNLENVQGDERDAIIFSVGYGPDASGKMTMHFGPINRAGGERRLNVAITRARQSVTIVSSFPPDHIDRGRSQARGVHLLRSYLEFAERGPLALLGETRGEGGEAESPFEEAVAEALRAHGLRVVPQVGVGPYRIDIGIREDHSDRYLLGVECDGATYHSSKTARDRDRLREDVLSRLGWRICRIWSTDWVKDPHRQTERVLAALAQAREATTAPVSPVQAPVVPSDQDDSPALTNVLPDHPPEQPTLVRVSRPYRRAVLRQQGDLIDFQLAPLESIAKLLEQIVEREVPVHEDRAMRVLAASFGISRVGSRVRERIVEAIELATKRGAFQRRGRFLWSTAQRDTPVRGVDPQKPERSIAEVPPEEIEACVEALVKRSFSISLADLVSSVARELGYRRTGSQISGIVNDAVDRLVTQGVLRQTGDNISASH